MLIEAIDRIEALGITHGAFFYLYYRPTEPNGNPITRVLGQELQDITIAAPYRSAADEHGL